MPPEFRQYGKHFTRSNAKYSLLYTKDWKSTLNSKINALYTSFQQNKARGIIKRKKICICVSHDCLLNTGRQTLLQQVSQHHIKLPANIAQVFIFPAITPYRDINILPVPASSVGNVSINYLHRTHSAPRILTFACTCRSGSKNPGRLLEY